MLEGREYESNVDAEAELNNARKKAKTAQPIFQRVLQYKFMKPVWAACMNATGLLATVGLDLYRGSGNTLILEGTTIGTQALDKIGFQNITLQRWQNDKWTNIKVWSTYKNNSFSYSYEYTTTVTPGYEYRFVATHYGEIDWLSIPSVETYYNETSYLYVDN